MKHAKRSFLFWLALLLYGVILTGALLYFRYPAAEVERYLALQVSKFTQGGRVEFGQCSYAMPLRLRCEKIRFTEDGTGDELMMVDSLTISPILAGLALKYTVTGAIAEGVFASDVNISLLKRRVELRGIEVTGVDLTRLPAVQEIMQREILGFADFQGQLSMSSQEALAWEGKLTIRDGMLPFRQQILLVEKQQMAPLEVQLSYSEGRLHLTEGSIKGSQLIFNFSGDLEVKGSLADWALTAAGSVVTSQQYVSTNPGIQRVIRRLQRQFKGESLPYMVSGSLRMPQFRFGHK